MPRKRFQEAKTFLQRLKSMGTEGVLEKIGLDREERQFCFQYLKAVFYTYCVVGAVWLFNETSPLGWFDLTIRSKAEKKMAHLYERVEYPYPGDKEAMKEFIARGGRIGTSFSPKGIIESDKIGFNFARELEKKKLEQEAQKLWLRMRNEVISELQEKGYDVE